MSSKLQVTLGGIVISLLLFAAVLYAFRENIVKFTLNPRTPYQIYTPPPRPDFARLEAWAAKPVIPSKAQLVPWGTAQNSTVPQADVFYIHPTTYYQSEHWNGPIADEEAGKLIDEVALASQASAFNLAGQIYAPRYRQATLYSMLTRNRDATSARQTAYADTRRAFRRYLQEDSDGRPIILVGYGQGGLYVNRLLQDFFVGKDLQQRLIAAYIIDSPVPLDLFEVSLNTLTPCETATDIQCVVSWIALEYGEDPTDIKNNSQVWNIFGQLTSTQDRPLTCINPLTWAANELPAPNPLNLGGVAWSRSRKASAPVPEITGAQCRDGILFVDDPVDSRFQRSAWPGSRHRVVDFNLFYMNTRENAAVRTKAWFNQQ